MAAFQRKSGGINKSLSFFSSDLFQKRNLRQLKQRPCVTSKYSEFLTWEPSRDGRAEQREVQSTPAMGRDNPGAQIPDQQSLLCRVWWLWEHEGSLLLRNTTNSSHLLPLLHLQGKKNLPSLLRCREPSCTSQKLGFVGPQQHLHIEKLEGTLKIIQIQPSGIQYCPPHLCDPSSCAPDVWWVLIRAGTGAEAALELWVRAKGGINQQEEQTVPRFKHSKPRILGKFEGFYPEK